MNEKSCVLKCPDEKYQDQSKCVTECPIGKYSDNEQICINCKAELKCLKC